jgi:WD40 repeat protein
LDNPSGYGEASGDYFGHYVKISGNYAILGVEREDDAGLTYSGKVYIFNATTGKLLHTLDNPSPANFSYFGGEADISGNYAIVSASGSNKVYIYNVTTGALIHTIATVGRSVAISGNYAIIGNATGSVGSAGEAYIYNVVTGTLVHTLDDPNAYGTSTGDNFGNKVAISGNYCIVAAENEDDANGTSSGKAYIFNVITGALLHTLDNPNPFGTSANDQFGRSVAISGNYAIVGAVLEDDAGGTQSGKAYIFNVTTGALLHTLDNPNAYGTSAGDNFGISVAISGNYAIVSARNEDDSGGTESGKAYIFSVTTGALVHTLDNPNAYGTSFVDYFGVSVAISGNYCIVGADLEGDSDGAPSFDASGVAYIFAVDNMTYLDKAIQMVLE